MKNLLSKEFNKFRNYDFAKKYYGSFGDEGNGVFEVKIDGKTYNIIASNGGGWEHVSVSNEKHTPSWKVMSKVKDLFFNDDETVVQFHPPKAEYVNIHQNCLHLWRSLEEDIKTPPTIFLGDKNAN